MSYCSVCSAFPNALFAEAAQTCCVRLRGLPYSLSAAELCGTLLANLAIAPLGVHLVLEPDGRPHGEASAEEICWYAVPEKQELAAVLANYRAVGGFECRRPDTSESTCWPVLSPCSRHWNLDVPRPFAALSATWNACSTSGCSCWARRS